MLLTVLKQGAKATFSFFIAFWIFNPVLFAEAPSLDLPSEFARVEKVQTGTNGKHIFFIQTAHVDYNAQKAIAEIIKNLVQKKALHLVLVEGGWGNTSLSYLRTYGSDEGRRSVAERYLKEGKISGEEYLDITSDLNVKFWGIENPEDYRKNMEVFLKFNAVQNELLAEIEQLETELLLLQDKLFSPAAKEFETERKAFHENQNSLIHYARFLRNKVTSETFEVYPQLKQLMALEGMEKSFDPDKVDWEKKEIIQALSRTVSKLEFDRIRLLKDRRNPEDELELIKSIFTLCRKHQNKLPKLNFKNLLRYSEILETMLQNDITLVFNEILSLESKVFDGLALSNDEKALFELINSVNLLEKLFGLEIGAADFKQIESNPGQLNVSEWNHFIAAQSGKASKIRFDFLNEWIDDAKAFYVSAIAREQALIQNAIQKIEETQVTQAAVLAGGFHTEHLAKAFQERGFSYSIISPRFVPADPKDQGRKYFEILKYKWDSVPHLTSNPS